MTVKYPLSIQITSQKNEARYDPQRTRLLSKLDGNILTLTLSLFYPSDFHTDDNTHNVPLLPSLPTLAWLIRDGNGCNRIALI
jgi:hypothetical protein